MMLSDLSVESDRWLSQQLGIPAYQLRIPKEKPKPAEISPLLSKLPTNSFLSTKIPTTRLDWVNTLIHHDFQIIDVNLTFQRKPEGASSSSSSDHHIRSATPVDQRHVLKIASSCFTYSRFHLDTEIPSTKANALKAAWVESYFQKQRGDDLFVVEKQDQILGFLAVLSDPIQSVRTIDLIGIDSNYQKQGLGHALVSWFIGSEASKRFANLQVGSQAANLPAVRLYEGLGFRCTSSTYVLHRHAHRLAEGKV